MHPSSASGLRNQARNDAVADAEQVTRIALVQYITLLSGLLTLNCSKGALQGSAGFHKQQMQRAYELSACSHVMPGLVAFP